MNESLKLVEDIIRFYLKNRLLLKKIRSIRHDFLKVKKLLPMTQIIRHRCSQCDLGRSAGFDRSGKRAGRDVMAANLNRAKEAARILEELLKPQYSKISGFMKEIRFQLYDIEKALHGAFDRLFNPSLYAILDEKYICSSNMERNVRTMVFSGVTMIQLRISSLSDREFLRYARRIQKTIRGKTVAFIINNRIDIAQVCDATGVHLGQDDISVGVARSLLGEHHIIGVSARTRAQALRAQKSGADYLGVGSIYPTQTKKNARVIGLQEFKKICKAVNIPVIGIGGINDRNYKSVMNAGASGIAVSSYLSKGQLGQRIRSLTGKHR